MQVLVSVELSLWSIFHDMAAIGCPLPADSKWVWGGDRRNQRDTLRPSTGGQQWEFYKSWGAQDAASSRSADNARAAPKDMSLAGSGGSTHVGAQNATLERSGGTTRGMKHDVDLARSEGSTRVKAQNAALERSNRPAHVSVHSNVAALTKRGSSAHAGHSGGSLEATAKGAAQPVDGGINLGAWVVNDPSNLGWD